jgi:hypothetical protein
MPSSRIRFAQLTIVNTVLWDRTLHSSVTPVTTKIQVPPVTVTSAPPVNTVSTAPPKIALLVTIVHEASSFTKFYKYTL